MKKFLSSLTILAILTGINFLIPNTLVAQCTVNPPSNNVGFYPDPAPSGCKGQPYDEVIQFVFPLDTTVVAPPFGTFVIPFDSFRVDGFTNVPTGVTITPNSSNNMYYPANSSTPAMGCANVVGTPTDTTTAPNDSVVVTVTAWVTAPFVGVQSGQTIFKLAFKVFNSPVTSFTSSASLNTVTFTNTSTASGSITWLWDFGDGNTSSLQNPGSHVYPSGSGNYTCCLIADNGNCADTTCSLISIGCPVPTADFSKSVNQLTVSFTDLTLGSPTSWFWDFGDGNTSTQQNPSHTYAAAGNYTVCLTSTDPCGTDSACKTVSACNAPVASFTSSANDLMISFTDNSTSGGTVSAWAWDFGDGNTSTSQNPTNSYSNPGTYTVCLTVTDACGTNTACNSITVTCSPNTAGFTWSAVNTSVTFTNTAGTANSPTFSWDFGDGSTSTLTSPSHTYAADGSYTVCVSLTDNCGSDQFCDTITVTTIGIEENTVFRGIQLFPNPAGQSVSLRMEIAEAVQADLQIRDVLGKTLLSKSLGTLNGRFEQKINLENIPAGLYFVQILSDKGNASLKFVKD